MLLSRSFLFSYATLAIAFAQQPAADSVASPAVDAGRKVTFRMLAPKAHEVSLSGDWMAGGVTKPMIKSADGVWSVTEGPMNIGMYIYSFTVDGVVMADPVNPRMKLRSRTSASLVEVPGDTPDFWQVKDVPHGSVDINWQKSKTINGETRSFWVYTPPDYEKNPNRRYPVLYLLHGSNDTAAGWVTAGNANFIIDNLLAEKKVVPMIVVMPYTHAVPFGSPREMQAKNSPLFDKYLVEDVMPYVDAKYRTAKGAANTALAGLSMGGGHSLFTGMSHVGMFSTVAIFSSASGADFDTRFASVLNHPEEFNKKVKLLWIGCGEQDPVFPRAKKLSENLTAHNIKHTFRSTEGAHTYTVWRQYLYELAPQLFR